MKDYKKKLQTTQLIFCNLQLYTNIIKNRVTLDLITRGSKLNVAGDIYSATDHILVTDQVVEKSVEYNVTVQSFCVMRINLTHLNQESCRHLEGRIQINQCQEIYRDTAQQSFQFTGQVRVLHVEKKEQPPDVGIWFAVSVMCRCKHNTFPASTKSA